MRIVFAVVLLSLPLNSPVYAEWLKVSESNSNSVWYMDPARVKVVGGKVEAWVKIDSTRDRTVQFAEMKELISFDCSADTYGVLSVIKYDTYGKVVSSATAPVYGVQYSPVVPESMAEAAEKLACVAVTAS